MGGRRERLFWPPAAPCAGPAVSLAPKSERHKVPAPPERRETERMPAPAYRRRTESAPGRPKTSRQNGRGLRGRRQPRARPNRRTTERMPALAPQRGRRRNQHSLNRGGTESPRRPFQAETRQQLPPVPLSHRGSDTGPAPPISEGDRRRGLPQKRMGTDITASLAKVRRLEKPPIILQDERDGDTSLPSIPQGESDGDPLSSSPLSPAPADETK